MNPPSDSSMNQPDTEESVIAHCARTFGEAFTLWAVITFITGIIFQVMGYCLIALHILKALTP